MRQAVTMPFSLRLSNRQPRGHRPVVLLAAALALALRLAYLGDASVWWDEGLAVWAARLPLAEMARWTASDVHPPLYFALLHLWRLLAGDSELAVRFLSAAFGTLTVVVVWKLGRLLAPKQPWVATLAACLLAISRFAVWWSQEARMYALAGLLFTLSLLFAVRLSRRADWRTFLGYVLATAAALWTLYLLALALVVEVLYWLWTLGHRPAWPGQRRALAGWVIAEAVVVAAFLPWLLYALPRLRDWSVQVPFDPGRFAYLYATLLSLGASANVDDYRLPVLAVVALVAAGTLALALAGRWPGRGAGLALLLLCVVLPPAFVWLLTTAPREFGYSPKPEARYLLPYAPAFYLLAAWGVVALAALAGRARQPAALVLVAALAVPQVWGLSDYYSGRYLTDDYQSLAATLRAHVRPDDLVLLHTDDPWPVFAYHWPGPSAGTPHLQDADPGGVDYFLGPRWGSHDAVWLVVNEDALRADPRRLYEGWLASRAVGSHAWRFGTKRLVAFARTPERAESLLALASGFDPPPPPRPLADGGLALVGWEQPLRRVRAGDVVSVAAYVARRGTGGTLAVSLGSPPLASAALDVPPGDDRVRLTAPLPVGPDAPPGRYPLRVGLGGATETLGEVEVLAGPAAPTPAEIRPEVPVGVTFGEPPLARLLGYDLSGPASPGGGVTVTLYWRVLTPTPLSYKVFTHLIGPDWKVAAQRDDFPVQGQRPTTTWRPGEVVVDRYYVELKPDLPPGAYPLRVGFYDPSTGQRLGPVVAAGTAQADDQMALGLVEVRGR